MTVSRNQFSLEYTTLEPGALKFSLHEFSVQLYWFIAKHDLDVFKCLPGAFVCSLTIYLLQVTSSWSWFSEITSFPWPDLVLYFWFTGSFRHIWLELFNCISLNKIVIEWPAVFRMARVPRILLYSITCILSLYIMRSLIHVGWTFMKNSTNYSFWEWAW